MKIDVKKVAKLANLPLTPEEEEKYSEQLSKILDYIEQLNKADTLRRSLPRAKSRGSGQASDVEPTFNVSGSFNKFRTDETSASLSQDEVLANAPQKKNGFFVTKRVFTKE